VVSNRLERFSIGEIKNKQEAIAMLQIAIANGWIVLLACCVQDIDLHFGAL
jgi:hypothetical protein